MSQPKSDSKLSFNKEKVANLSTEELNTVEGGAAVRSNNSTRADFTCCMCTTLVVEEPGEGLEA
ncbi:MAG TPA: class I lanthipeptide [Chitinophaga sp.]|uniref:class I lanthipeptide n=1 Tax=Chitinophaga sp. TaxID=1869181 RepID=UPI002C3BCFEA|nr:class I lanthipeptide [Chitinophaga sp.]HVI46007.1 class I lanthipeptide [Chitinophaga sp.]